MDEDVIGTEVGLGPGDIMLDWDPASSPKGAQPPIFGPCLLWRNGRPSQLLLSTCFLELHKLYVAGIRRKYIAAACKHALHASVDLSLEQISKCQLQVNYT